MKRFLQRCAILVVAVHILPQYSLPQSPRPDASQSTQRLTEQQVRGEGLFIQRCSLCHLPQARRLRPTAPRLGPNLSGLLKGNDPRAEAAVRESILKGGPRMPGFQYGLSEKEIDDLIAYLKVL